MFRHQAIGGNYSLFGQPMWQELFLRAGFTLVWGIELNRADVQVKDSIWGYLLRKPA